MAWPGERERRRPGNTAARGRALWRCFSRSLCGQESSPSTRCGLWQTALTKAFTSRETSGSQILRNQPWNPQARPKCLLETWSVAVTSPMCRLYRASQFVLCFAGHLLMYHSCSKRKCQHEISIFLRKNNPQTHSGHRYYVDFRRDLRFSSNMYEQCPSV